MYPLLRFFWGAWRSKRLPPIGLHDTHVSRHTCMPWDIDLWNELNNGRTLTLYDLGRIPLAVRSGMWATLSRNKWGMTVAGCMVRYRRRILMFETFEMRSRAIGWDDKFFYIEQSLWKKHGECANHAVYRTAIIHKGKLVPAPEVMAAHDSSIQSPDLPEWLQSWLATEEKRPWPPMQPVE